MSAKYGIAQAKKVIDILAIMTVSFVFNKIRGCEQRLTVALKARRASSFGSSSLQYQFNSALALSISRNRRS